MIVIRDLNENICAYISLTENNVLKIDNEIYLHENDKSILQYIDNKINVCIYNILYNKFNFNFNLVYKNRVLLINENIILDDPQDELNIYIIYLPTNYLTVYNENNKEIIKINVTHILNNNYIYNFKYRRIIHILNDLQIYMNDEYCILSNPELYIYSYINTDNSISFDVSNTNLKYLLYDLDFTELDTNYTINVIKLLSPIYFEGTKNVTPENIVNSYLISKCAKKKYKFDGLITDYNIEINKFNEKIHIFTINNNHIISYFQSIESLYFMPTLEKYEEYKTYFLLNTEKN